MNKLQIFSKYLPYGAKCIRTRIKAPRYSESKVLDHTDMPLLENKNYDFKLFLRPLSSVTESEWLDVLKSGLPGHNLSEDYVSIEEEWVYLCGPKYGCRYKIYIGNDEKFAIVTDENYPEVLNILESLYALHVDIHGAIELGFAGDKTKLKS